MLEKEEVLKEDPLVKYEREVWDSLGEPMTQEELDELHCIGSEEDALLSDGLEYAHGYSAGYDFGFEKGYTEAEKDIRDYNVVLSGDFLAEVKELSTKISSYHKKGEKDHNFMLYDINDALMNVVESWAMEQIYDFWNSMDEDDEEDEIE